MPAYNDIVARNAAYAPSYIPTAVFVGGTSGIGQAMAQALARALKGRCNIILIGRNYKAAETTIASFPKPDPDLKVVHEFIHCDVFLMKNIHTTASVLRERFSKINFLVLTTGIMRFRGRQDTTEGLDKKMALLYYARWTFIHDLVPSLNNAKASGEDAKVMSVLSCAQIRY